MATDIKYLPSNSGRCVLLARIAHAYGITRADGKSIFRAIGTLATILVYLCNQLWGLLSLSWFLITTGAFETHEENFFF